jgi:hypothetical protein
MKIATSLFQDCAQFVKMQQNEIERKKLISETQAEEERQREKDFLKQLLERVNKTLNETLEEEPEFMEYLTFLFNIKAQALGILNDQNPREIGLLLLKEDTTKKDGRALMITKSGKNYRFGVFDLYEPSGVGYMRELALAGKPIKDELNLLIDSEILIKVILTKFGVS